MSNRRQHPESHAQDRHAQPTELGETIRLQPVDDQVTVPPGSMKIGPAHQTLRLPPQRPMSGREPSSEVRPVPTPVTQAYEAATVWLPQPVTEPAPEEFNNTTLLDPNAWAASTQPVPAPTDEELHRFGPGISLQTADTWHKAALPPTDHPRRKRRWLLPLLIVLSALAFLIWQRYEQPVSIAKVTVHTDAAGPACNRTFQITGVLETDGGAGEVTYRWRRSDGTNSGVLTQHVPKGHHTTELMLRWTFQGHGTMQATATLEILTPIPTSAAVTFPYTCR